MGLFDKAKEKWNETKSRWSERKEARANKVEENCKISIFELKGAIAAVEDILKPDEPVTES